MTAKKPDYADALEHWLRFDNWFPYQAFALFTEDDPEKQGTGLGGAQLDFDRVAAKKNSRNLEQIWSSGNDPEQMVAFPPIHFIEWAIQKKITIPWLEWAKKEGLIRHNAEIHAENGQNKTRQVNATGNSGASTGSIISNAEKHLTTNERNTLLIIIAALCEYSDIKHQDRGAAKQIADLTDEIKASVTDDTIRKILAKIPDAMEARMK